MFNVPELVRVKRLPVLAAFEPDKVTSTRLPVKAVAVEEISKAPPEVRELATMALASAVVAGEVNEVSPELMVKSPAPEVPSIVREVTVEAAFESKPKVMVTNPEIVGIAVQAVPVTVKFPPKEVR